MASAGGGKKNKRSAQVAFNKHGLLVQKGPLVPSGSQVTQAQKKQKLTHDGALGNGSSIVSAPSPSPSPSPGLDASPMNDENSVGSPRLKATSTTTTTTASSSSSSSSTSNGSAAADGEQKEEPWTIQDSDKVYHVHGWGAPYFRINEAGNIEVDPSGKDGNNQADPLSKIDLLELVEDVIKRGHNLPLLIRFSDILRDRIRLLHEAFHHAIKDNDYKNCYRGVFPVKVCQQSRVVEEIVKYGKKYTYGLEAGSKPELLIVLACLTTPGAIITCNGYKDSEYVETAMLSQRLGQIPIIIIEKLYEIDLVVQAAQKLKIKPIVGVRAKLSTQGTGRWGGSTGDHAKFGLSSAEIMEVHKKLKAADLLDSLQLLHFHIGSQISRISVVKDALREAGQFFVELHKLGAQMSYVDIGGGLGIDYDGSKTSFHASMNYTVGEYAQDVVVAIKKVCDKHNIPHPVIVSESGRAVVSHQTVLVLSTLGATRPMITKKEAVEDPGAKAHTLVKQLWEVYSQIVSGNPKVNLQECYHDAQQFKGEAYTLFTLGLLSLEDRSKAEELYWMCCIAIQPLAKRMAYVPEELQNLDHLMSAIYYCNFSVFQSVPDNWAIDQLFPVMPIHRLREKPTQLAILADLTCDSDGKIDQFICSGTDDVKSFLEVHELDDAKPYYIGIFLNGAYQEVLGNLHNLYGDTNVIHVNLDPEDAKGYTLEHVVKGDTTDEVLRWMQYDPKVMTESIRQQAELALKAKKLTHAQYRLLVKHYEKSLQKYTYLWADED
jgi:arginine decarboxylase